MHRKPLSLSIALVVSAGGFAGASILASGSLGAVADALTGTTVIQTLTTATTALPNSGRRVVVCHRRGHHDVKTIVIDQHALWVHLRHGDLAGACITGTQGKHGEAKGHGHADVHRHSHDR